MKNSFKGIKDILQIGIKAVLIALIVFGSFSYFNKVFYDKTVSRGESFHALPEDSMDVIVLGSSHAQYSFVPSFFYQETGLYSYVLGSACQPLEVSYEMLKEALKTQSPKLVILEVYTAMPLRELCEADSCYVLAEYQMTGQERINTINYLPKDKAETYYNDFISLHNNWRYVEDYDRVLPQNVLGKEKPGVDYSFGHVFSNGIEWLPGNWWHPSYYYESVEVELDDLDLESLNNIYDLCKENDIELFLYKAPMDSMDVENQSYLHKVWEWADERNIQYVDFIKESYDIGFYMWIHSDSYHSYISGAGMITEYLSNKIKEINYDFKHENNDELNSLYSASDQDYMISYIRGETDPLKYLKLLDDADGIIIIRYNPVAAKLDDRLYDYMIKMGMNDFDIHKTCYAVIQNGELLAQSTEPLEYKFNDEYTIFTNHEGMFLNGTFYIDAPAALGLLYTTNSFNDIVTKNIDYYWLPWDHGADYYER